MKLSWKYLSACRQGVSKRRNSNLPCSITVASDPNISDTADVNDDTFTMSAAEARRMRRGAFLPAPLILIMAAMFGFDQSKSQPMHFLMVFCVAIGISAAVCSISWYGAKRRIDGFSRTSLVISDASLIWTSALGRSELQLSDVAAISIQKTRGTVRSISLTQTGGGNTLLEGYNSMEALADKLTARSSCPVSITNSWVSI